MLPRRSLRQARLGPRPVGIVLGGDAGEAGLPDLDVDGDEVADDLGEAVGKRCEPVEELLLIRAVWGTMWPTTE